MIKMTMRYNNNDNEVKQWDIINNEPKDEKKRIKKKIIKQSQRIIYIYESNFYFS